MPQPARRAVLHVAGAVQGVGFRPFVYRLAQSLGLAGHVCNAPAGVCIEIEGEPAAIGAFLERLPRECPPLARILRIETEDRAPRGGTHFEIRHSRTEGPATALVLPDIAACAECLREMRTPGDRRYGYPFVNCTHCGPRYTIQTAIPYDRANTAMAAFAMCAACRAEYEDPGDRRFHAQPIACPGCGPQLAWIDGPAAAARGEALEAAAAALRAGRIVAAKGLGGFHLLCDARNGEALERLRARKGRDAKPFAAMYPSLDALRRDAAVSPLEAALLESPEAPIVLLDANSGTDYEFPPGAVDPVHAGAARAEIRSLSPNFAAIAPGLDTLGAMLPYTPLHALLLDALGFPIVATSGNRSEEPICIGNGEARARLDGIADAFLLHDRPIVRAVDDSVVRVIDGQPMVLRRARGFAPLPAVLPHGAPPTLAVGGHLKNTVAVSKGPHVFLSQHLGDLDTAAAYDAFQRAIADLETLFAVRPARVAHDLHPAYRSTLHALGSGLPALAVQHHHAHVLAVMAEHAIEGPVLGVAWDGTGYGPDGTVWGGEFLRCEGAAVERAAALRPFALPGGEAAIRAPWRAAAGLLHAAYGPAWRDAAPAAWRARFDPAALATLDAMLDRGVHCPVTTSAGRLFDAVASLTGLCDRNRFEGEAAMRLEACARAHGRELETARAASQAAMPPALPLAHGADPRDAASMLDWQPMLDALLRNPANPPAIAHAFHSALADTIVEAARRIALDTVILCGGCFQNRLLAEAAAQRLRTAGFTPLLPRQFPPGDGAIALGQALYAARNLSDPQFVERPASLRVGPCSSAEGAAFPQPRPVGLGTRDSPMAEP